MPTPPPLPPRRKTREHRGFPLRDRLPRPRICRRLLPQMSPDPRYIEVISDRPQPHNEVQPLHILFDILFIPYVRKIRPVRITANEIVAELPNLAWLKRYRQPPARSQSRCNIPPHSHHCLHPQKHCCTHCHNSSRLAPTTVLYQELVVPSKAFCPTAVL